MSSLARRSFLLAIAIGCLASACLTHADQQTNQQRPNIIFILADDQGVGDVGCYGQKAIKTPNIDKLAAEGMLFTQAYSGSAVCAPTRAVLMTGLHTGHARRRDNVATAGKEEFKERPLVPLERSDVTIATILKRAGYVTGGFGKWGLGNPGTTGTPEQHGFDHFYGYLDQAHAHDYYTKELWRDGKMVPLQGNEGNKGTNYSHDAIADAALDFVRQYKDRPFFLYLPFTPPHGKYEVPSQEQYANEPWSDIEKNYAAMNSRLDRDVGRLMALLKELKLDENTIVFYSSDNGPNPPFKKQFDSAAGLRGVKRDLYEGGIRCPLIVRWPGKIAPGSKSDFITSHVDFLATTCAIAGIDAIKTDGLSVLPTLLGKEQKPHDYLYWEIYDPFQQAVRMGNWKAIRFGTRAPVELYDLSKDSAESTDVAGQHAEVVKKIEQIMNDSHVDSKYWPTVERPAKKKKRG